jgi:hypothetical protein
MCAMPFAAFWYPSKIIMCQMSSKNQFNSQKNYRMPHSSRGGVVRKRKIIDDDELWKSKNKSKKCSKHYHEAPIYDYVHDHKNNCIRDCDTWTPPRYKGPRGGCRNIMKGHQSAWVSGLQQHYQAEKERNPRYTYTQAMYDFSEIYKSTDDKSIFL